MNFKSFILNEEYYLASDIEVDEIEPRRLAKLGNTHIILVYADTLKSYKSLLGHSANASSRYNYIYEVDAKRIFTWSVEDFTLLIKNKVLDIAKANEYFGKPVDAGDLSKYFKKDKSAYMLGHLIDTDKFFKLYDGLASEYKGEVHIPFATMLKAKLVDGNAKRYHTGDKPDLTFDIPEHYIEDLIRYTEDPGKRLKHKEYWKSLTKPYKFKILYRGFSIQFDDWGDYSKVTFKDVNDKLKRYAGITLGQVPAGKVIVKRGKESSWSTHKEIAQNFTKGQAEASINFVVRAEVPVDNIIIDFTEFPMKFKKQFRFFAQNEVIVDTGAVPAVIEDVWIEKDFATWMKKNGIKINIKVD